MPCKNIFRKSVLLILARCNVGATFGSYETKFKYLGYVNVGYIKSQCNKMNKLP
jgi:hypothetical protein